LDTRWTLTCGYGFQGADRTRGTDLRITRLGGQVQRVNRAVAPAAWLRCPLGYSAAGCCQRSALAWRPSRLDRTLTAGSDQSEPAAV